MKKLRCTIILLLFCSMFPLFGQESIGLISDNYTPTIGMRLNPSTIADQKPWMSIHLAGFNTYFRNNLVYLEDSKIQWANEESTPTFNTTRNTYKAYIDVEVYGPSVSFTFQKHSFGVHTAVRSYSFVRNIPSQLGDYIDEQESFEIEAGNYSIKNVEAKGMAWGELGLTYAQVFKQTNNEMWTWGATINKLYGIGAAGIEISEANLEIRDTLDFGLIGNADANYFYNDPAFKSGKGWGINAGLTYKKMKSDVTNHIPHSPKGACNIPNYKYKIGFSIVDFGYVNHTVNAEAGNLTTDFTTDDLESIINDDLTDQIVLNTSTEFRTALPFALSLQYDYSLTDRVYLNGTIIQNLEFIRASAIKRSNTLSTSIRFESRWFGVALPLSLHNYSVPQVGLSLRFGTIAIGTDHISPFLVKSDVYATDLYFAFHIPILRNPSCAEKGKSKKPAKKSTKGYPPCPKW